MKFRLFDLNPEQYDAATHENGPMLILAGAGTGKTRTVTARIAWLISQGVDASKMMRDTHALKDAGVDAVNVPDGPRAQSRMGLGAHCRGAGMRTF